MEKIPFFSEPLILTDRSENYDVWPSPNPRKDAEEGKNDGTVQGERCGLPFQKLDLDWASSKVSVNVSFLGSVGFAWILGYSKWSTTALSMLLLSRSEVVIDQVGLCPRFIDTTAHHGSNTFVFVHVCPRGTEGTPSCSILPVCQVLPEQTRTFVMA